MSDTFKTFVQEKTYFYQSNFLVSYLYFHSSIILKYFNTKLCINPQLICYENRTFRKLIHRETRFCLLNLFQRGLCTEITNTIGNRIPSSKKNQTQLNKNIPHLAILASYINILLTDLIEKDCSSNCIKTIKWKKDNFSRKLNEIWWWTTYLIWCFQDLRLKLDKSYFMIKC